MARISDLRFLFDLAKKAATIEERVKIVEAQEAILEIREENLSLRTRIEELEIMLQTKAELSFDDPVYWRIINDQKEGPYCQACYDSKGELMRLQSGNLPLQGPRWFCTVCGTDYIRE